MFQPYLSLIFPANFQFLSSFDLTSLHLDFVAGYFMQTGRAASPEAGVSNIGRCNVLADLEQFTANVLICGGDVS